MHRQIERPLPFVPAHCFDDEPLTVTADEAFAANELTEAQAWDYVTSQPCFAHVTVARVIGDDRLRLLAARHAMNVMQ